MWGISCLQSVDEISPLALGDGTPSRSSRMRSRAKTILKELYRWAFNPGDRWRNYGLPLTEAIRLQKIPRRTKGYTTFKGRKVKFTDSTTFLNGVREIFGKDIYFFGERGSPLIIDCGANIGHSVIYLKQRYPDARIEAYEPDPEIFDALKFNVDSFNLDRVDLHNAAVWSENGTVEFSKEGGFSGRVSVSNDDNLTEVPAASLGSIVSSRDVDLLKMDIEGAEYEALKSNVGQLQQVKNIFIEYHSHEERPQRLHEILEMLRGIGFRYHIHEAFTRDKPFVDNESMLGMDLQLNIFGRNSMRDE